MILGAENGDILFMDPRTGSKFAQFPTSINKNASITALKAFDSQKSILVGNCQGDVMQFDVRNMAKLIELKIHDRKYDDCVNSLDISKERYIASAGADGFIKILK